MINQLNSNKVRAALRNAIAQPSLAASRALEQILIESGCKSRVFGRINQKSSIEAASESDRGITERLANAFDASLTAARQRAGIPEGDPNISPRWCAQKFFCPDRTICEWTPQNNYLNFGKPIIQFWLEDKQQKHRYRKHNPKDGLATVLIRDHGLGIAREDMPRTILDLNSDAKLRAFEAEGVPDLVEGEQRLAWYSF